MSYRFLLIRFMSFLRLAIFWSLLVGATEFLPAAERFTSWMTLPFASAFISVIWIRALLLGRGFAFPSSFGLREWRFLRISLIPTAIVGGVVTLIRVGWPTSMNDPGPVNIQPIFSILLLFGIWVLATAPLLLSLSATAVDDHHRGLRWSLRTTLPFLIPIFLGIVVTRFPILVLAIFSVAIGHAIGSSVGKAAIFSAIGSLLLLANDAALAGLASYVYRELGDIGAMGEITNDQGVAI